MLETGYCLLYCSGDNIIYSNVTRTIPIIRPTTSCTIDKMVTGRRYFSENAANQD